MRRDFSSVMQEPAAGSEAQAHGQYLNLPASTAAFDAAPLIPHTIDVLRKVRDNLEMPADMVADVSQVRAISRTW